MNSSVPGLTCPSRITNYSVADKKRILDRLIWSITFEQFCAVKFTNYKRFGLDGGESMVPGIKAMVDRCADHGVEDPVMGLNHRGRISVMSNLFRKPDEAIFNEFPRARNLRVRGPVMCRPISE